jgi:hypothetical protein
MKRIADSSLFVIVMGLILDIADPTIGATYITTLSSLSNIGKTMGDPLSVTLMSYINFFTLCLYGLAIESIFAYWFYS